MSRAVISGRKGDDTPSEAPNTLKSIANARVLLALGEGEFEGGIDGKRIFLDGTPLVSKSGTLNFTDVSWSFRPGSVDQEYIAGFPSVESETAIGVELKSDTPWVRTLTNSLLSACVIRFRWPALQAQKDNGDLVGYSISYRIDISADGGAFETVSELNVTGKTTSDYERSVRVDLPAGSSWTIRVVRLTPNQNSSKYADLMYVAAITEVIDRKLRYPNTALLGISFDATQFSNIPQISVLAKLRKIRVPDNYDPETRTYTGIWTGGFKLAYSNNPAWVTYDLIIENRFSIGDKVGPEFVNKYELYKIAQYCDQQVPDGKGGTEHRFECNIYIQTAAEAWQVLRDISAIYRGMVYWMQSQMIVRADMPRDPDYIFTNSNVIDGVFTYSGSDERTKYTRALVSYDNPDNQYETDVTTTFDSDLQRRYGDNVVELAAYGCTRESEAQRRGKWAIYTNNTDRMVTFKTGMEGEIPLLGDIVQIADDLIAGVTIGGRISTVSDDGKIFTLDREVELLPGDSLLVNLPSGKSESRSVVSSSGRTVEVSLPYSEKPNPYSQWTIERETITHQLFQVLSVKKSDTESIEYEISGIEYDPGKFDYVDTGARLEDRPVSNIPVGGQEPPAEVTISQSVHVEQTIAITTMTISWTETEGAVGYDVQWQKDNGEWVNVPRTGQISIDVKGVYSGQYIARVRAFNAAGVASIAKSSNLTDIVGKEGEPPALALFRTESRAFEIYLDWAFPSGAEDTLYTEVQYSTDAQGTTPILLGNYSYPTSDHSLSGLAAGVEFWFRARIIDRTGNIGPWTGWTYGRSSVNSDEILSYLEGQIGEGQLAPGLIEQIGEDIAAGIIIDVDQKLDVINQTIADLETSVNDKIDQVEVDFDGKIDQVEVDFDGKIDDINQNLIGHLTGDDENASEDVLWYAGDDGTQESFVGNVSTTSAYNSEDYARAKRTSILAARVGDNESYIANVEAVSVSRDEALAQVISELSVKVDDNAALIATEQTVRSNADESLARSITALKSSVGDNSAKIILEQTTRADADTALSQQITALSAQVDDNSSAITVEQTARADGDEALAQQITALTAEVGDNSSAILEEQTARADGDSALAQQITALTAEVDDNSASIITESEVRAGAVADLNQKTFGYLSGDDESTEDLFSWFSGDDETEESNVGNVSATSATNEGQYSLARQISIVKVESDENKALISSEQTARITADEALAADINALLAQVNENKASIITEQEVRASEDEALSRLIQTLGAKAGDNAAAILNEQKVRVDADSALAADINALLAQVNENKASIITEQEVRASEDEALSRLIQTLGAKVGDNAAAILNEQKVRVDADSALAEDIQTLSVQLGDAEAAIQQTSQVVADLDGSLKANWQVKTEVRQDGKVVQAGVGLGASIGEDGTTRSEFLVMADTVGFLNSIDGQVHSPFVFDTVNDTAFLNAVFIGDATIDFAKITNTLQSTDYQPQTLGWKLDKNGLFENNGSDASGRMVQSNTRIDVFDANGNLRVRIGKLN